MTRQQFIDQHYHELYGLIADAFCVSRQGGELSMAMQLAAQKLRTRLGLIHDQLVPAEQAPIQPPRPAVNVTGPAPGAAQQGRK